MMESFDHDAGHVFSIPDLWGHSRLLDLEQEQASFLFSALRFDDIDRKELEPTSSARYENGFFRVPDISPDLFPGAGTPNQLPESSNEVKDAPESDLVHSDDIWLFQEENPMKTANYLTWDTFHHGIRDLYTSYIAEAGPQVFDAVAVIEEDYLRLGNTTQRVLNKNVYIPSLLALGLGRNSVLFAWDDEKQAFGPTMPGMRISGCTSELLGGLTAFFLDCGNTTRALQKFVDETYANKQSPGRIALADTLSTLLITIQAELSHSNSAHTGVLQLQNLFQPAHSILKCSQHLILNIAKTYDDESMLSAVFEEIQSLEHRTNSLKDIFLEVLARVSRPWLEFASEWVGTRREAGVPITREGNGKSFVQLHNKEWIDDQGLGTQSLDYVMDYSRMPSFFAPEDAKTLFVTGKTLRFLKEHHAEHPLSKADIVASANPPSFEWKFSWQDIVQIEAKALQYEKDMTAAINKFSTSISRSALESAASGPAPGTVELNFFGKPPEDMQANVLASIDTFNQPLIHALSDPLSKQVKKHLSQNVALSSDYDSVFAPPIYLTPLLSIKPIISAQARLVNLTSMRMLFNSHKLREHLSLQRNFQLLGNGVFSSRLSHALFDLDLQSAERHQGVARSGGMMGLRLGGRDTWPPASSELRLALMGVLTESYVSSHQLDRSGATTYVHSHSSLPGELSFAVRELTEEEIEKCINPDSMEALDFLRLSYKPPAPLEGVITPIILYKYDRLFRLLLRVTRMLYVVSTLFRDATDHTSKWQGVETVAQRFRIEAQHFVSNVCGYFFDTGIEATWRLFEQKLDQIEARINGSDENARLGQNDGLDKLGNYHDRVVDRIMFALLLRKRQQPVMKLLEETFGLILEFSKLSRDRAMGRPEDQESDDKVRELYKQFRKKVEVFITVCKGLSETKGYGERKSTDAIGKGDHGVFDDDDLAEENTVAQLVTRLDMSGYFSKILNI